MHASKELKQACARVRMPRARTRAHPPCAHPSCAHAHGLTCRRYTPRRPRACRPQPRCPRRRQRPSRSARVHRARHRGTEPNNNMSCREESFCCRCSWGCKRGSGAWALTAMAMRRCAWSGGGVDLRGPAIPRAHRRTPAPGVARGHRHATWMKITASGRHSSIIRRSVRNAHCLIHCHSCQQRRNPQGSNTIQC